jgi:hypothetical protein
VRPLEVSDGRFGLAAENSVTAQIEVSLHRFDEVTL